MDLFETIKLPLRTIDGRKCLTFLQMSEQPWLQLFINKFPKYFAYDSTHYVCWFYPDGKPNGC